MVTTMKKVELLAPAGNFEALTGAVSAGADAVYLGGQMFGARAYADNFTQEEICEGIYFAHLFGRKIYLTVNTLVKEREFKELYSFLLPFYEAGLDGVIIQDFGVFEAVRRMFPGLSLHVSTQMTVTGVYGARLLKEAGAERIVPARELSLEEMRQIREQAGIEVESFIHGAMCYGYSGQCLFSSILGGRSGNRGRCAQPCRLPYRVNDGKESYPLSMKDMCTLSILPELIESGIDSFKIEGRMKKPEYAAGVTALYRKYIDLYYANPSAFQVEEKDLAYLKSLYIRSGIGEGYYHRHNGKEMITLDSPAYSGSDDSLLNEIRQKWIEQKPQLSVAAKALLKTGKEAELSLFCEGCEVTVKGSEVQKAKKQPLSKEKIKEQLQKSGGTYFSIDKLLVEADEDVFMPVSALNALRREALAALEEVVIEKNGLLYPERKAEGITEEKADSYVCGATDRKSTDSEKSCLHVLVNTKEQLDAAQKQHVKRIYLDKLSIDEMLLAKMKEAKETDETEYYLVFPYIVRNKDEAQLKHLYQLLQEDVFDGALVRNLETVGFLKEQGFSKKLCADSGLYAWNAEAYHFLKKYADEIYHPSELNYHERKDLKEQAFSYMIYGRLPLMISANCLKKTSGACRKEAGYVKLSDRYQKEFPVYTDCNYCYNIIYNSVPVSLHKPYAEGKFAGACRLDFTTETKEETKKVIEYFKELEGNVSEPFYQEFTTGHYKRGVE